MKNGSAIHAYMTDSITLLGEIDVLTYLPNRCRAWWVNRYGKL